MISSVMERSTNRSPSMPSYREKSSGSPSDDADPARCGILRPIGCTLSVPIIATGITGTFPSSAIRAMPVLPR